MAEEIGAAPGRNLRAALVPLALAQFVCSFAGSNMNVMINDISRDLDTTVQGVQIAITVFLLVMAALMIPGGKLTDKWGRKQCFVLGLAIYAVGALMSAASPGLGVLILGNSILEGIGTALLIPPVYILTTMLFTGLGRSKAFGVIMAMAGVGSAAGPLIGGFITTAISWRAAFVFQALIVATILVLARRLDDPVAPDPSRHFDLLGAILSAGGLALVVMGILQADTSPGLMAVLLVLGAVLLALFFWHIHAVERSGGEPLLRTELFQKRTSNVAMVTQLLQWLLLLGTAFVVSAYLQVVRGYNAIETGMIFTAATAGLLVSSVAARRLAERWAQRSLIMAGFGASVLGIGLLLAMVAGTLNVWAFSPGLLLLGLGVGVMLTPSVNVVQSAFPEELQGEISGLSRSVSNLGSSLGTAIAGTILVADLIDRNYAAAQIVLAIAGVAGLLTAAFLPHDVPPGRAERQLSEQQPSQDRGARHQAVRHPRFRSARRA